MNTTILNWLLYGDIAFILGVPSAILFAWKVLPKIKEHHQRVKEIHSKLHRDPNG